jgi:hypothetical protein
MGSSYSVLTADVCRNFVNRFNEGLINDTLASYINNRDFPYGMDIGVSDYYNLKLQILDAASNGNKTHKCDFITRALVLLLRSRGFKITEKDDKYYIDWE